MTIEREDLRQIVDAVAAAGIEEFSLEVGDLKVRLSRQAAGTGGPLTPAAGRQSAPGAGGAPSTASGQPVPGTGGPLAPGAEAQAASAAGRQARPGMGGPSAPAGAAPPASRPTVAEPPAAAASAGAAPDETALVPVKAPLVGTFYRAPSPDAPPFVEVGSLVEPDDTVCIVEVMKLMNGVPAGCRGRVVRICADNAALVEYGQTLMLIEPAA
jgi:acetyl-CoA carboxylase biotin carboxyl carrier protein